MIIKTAKKAAEIVPPGEYVAELRQVNYKRENAVCVMDYAIQHEGKTVLVPREVPASLDSGPLLDELATLNGTGFAPAQIEAGIDPAGSVGRRCRVIVVQKRTSGRKLVATVSVILPIATAEATTARAADLKPGPQQAAT